MDFVLSKNVLVVYDQLVPANQLHCVENYCKNQTHLIENTIISEKSGFIQKIVEILSIQFKKVDFETHKGNIVFEIKVMAAVINPERGDIIQCTVNKVANLVFSIMGPLRIIIRDSQNQIIETQKDMKIKVLQTQFDKSNNKIKVISDPYFDKIF